ncbi:MAG TPA: archease [Candidatus Obscuribacterales bacterium]
MVTASAGFEILDHPADMGFRAWSPSLDDLFAQSALALTSTLTDCGQIANERAQTVDLSAPDLETLMYNWLSEILFLFDGDGLLLGKYQVTISDRDGGKALSAVLSGEGYDSRKHEIRTYVKAITFHQMRIELRESQWSATVFLDI